MVPETADKLWEDSEYLLWREAGVLRLAPTSGQPNKETLARLERSYALRDLLDGAWRYGRASWRATTVGSISCLTIQGGRYSHDTSGALGQWSS